MHLQKQNWGHTGYPCLLWMQLAAERREGTAPTGCCEAIDKRQHSLAGRLTSSLNIEELRLNRSPQGLKPFD